MPPASLPTFLSALTALGIFVGVSLILPGRSGFLLGGRPLRPSALGPVLELTGIGGGVTHTDRSVTDAARREAVEEIGCDVRLLDSATTLIVRDRDHIETVSFIGAELPVAIVFRGYRTPPHEPWYPEHRGATCLVVFLAELLGCPRPSAELPLLAWLNPETLCAAAHTDLPFSRMSGELSFLSPAACPPGDAPVRLTDSQEALILALGDRALPFYRTLAQRSG